MSNPQPGAGAKACPKCGYPIAAWEETCTYCGQNQTTACQQCGSTISAGTLFCPYCGTRAPLPQSGGSPTSSSQPPSGTKSPQPVTSTQASTPSTSQPSVAQKPTDTRSTSQQHVQAPPTTIKPPPSSIKDPIDALAAELGISYVRAKRIFDEGLGIEDLQKMRLEKVAKVVGDPGIASAIKQKIGHVYTEGEMDEICHEVSSDIDALVSFATRVGFNMDEMKRAVEYLRSITREKRVREAIEYAERLKGASIAFHKEAIAKARGEIETTISRMEKHKRESRALVEAIAKIDVALGMNDYPGARRAAITGLDSAGRSRGEVETVEGDLHEINDAIDLAKSLNLHVEDLKNDSTSAERLTAQGDFAEAKKIIAKCKVDLEERISVNMKGLILTGKRRLLDLKMSGHSIQEAKALLDSAKAHVVNGEAGKALSAYMKFREIVPESAK